MTAPSEIRRWPGEAGHRGINDRRQIAERNIAVAGRRDRQPDFDPRQHEAGRSDLRQIRLLFPASWLRARRSTDLIRVEIRSQGGTGSSAALTPVPDGNEVVYHFGGGRLAGRAGFDLQTVFLINDKWAFGKSSGFCAMAFQPVFSFSACAKAVKFSDLYF